MLPQGPADHPEFLIQREDNAVIILADRGRGIPSSVLPHLFSRPPESSLSRGLMVGGAGYSLMLARGLQRRGACYELHIFPGGAHGSSLCTREVGCPNAHNRVWMELALNWLADVFDYHL